MKYTRETRADYGTGRREYVEFERKNSKGETIAIELSTAKPLKQWCGIKQKTYIAVTVYATDKTGCWGRYNPQVTADHKINFDYLPEDTEENRIKVIEDVYRLAF